MAQYAVKSSTLLRNVLKTCKRACAELEIDYSHRDVKLFLTDGDGTEECTEEGELAG